LDMDSARDLRVATRGAYVGIDCIGYDHEKGTPEHPAPPWSRWRADRMRQLLDLLEAGHADRTVVSADANCSPLGWESPPHSVAELLEYFLPDLRAAGADQELVDQLLIRNPAQLLAMDAIRAPATTGTSRSHLAG
jgi:predicted metal-dependent phosphotriesterase family hydrolase